MQLNDKLSVIEAILFACGEPVEAQRLCDSAEVEPEELPRLILALNQRYSDSGSSLVILLLNQSYQLSTKKEFAPYIRAAVENKRNCSLSPAALEVLTIIAYNQPITRSFIDDVRGVDSSGVVNSLVEKELIEEAGRLDIQGRPVLFKTTENFLRCFGLTSIEDLPPLPTEYSQLSFDDVDAQNSIASE